MTVNEWYQLMWGIYGGSAAFLALFYILLQKVARKQAQSAETGI